MRKLPESWIITIRTIVLAIIIGAGSGVLATALTTNYLSEYALQIGEYTQPLRLAEERPRTYPETLEEALEEVELSVLPGVATFYPLSTQNAVHYFPEQAVLSGVVMTSDGWILTQSHSQLVSGGLAVVVQGTSYVIDEIVEDTVTNSVFVKVDADHLPVLAFGPGFDVQLGDQVFLTPDSGRIYTTVVNQFDWGSALLRSSDEPSRRLLVSESVTEEVIGAPVSNLAGELVGVVDDVDEVTVSVLPIDALLPAFNQLLSTDVIDRSALGVSVVDITHTIGLSDELTRGYAYGALLYGTASLPYGSAGSEAGLLSGDIILSVDGQVVNGARSLDEYLLEYQSGDEVQLSLDRGGEVMSLTALLD